MCLLRKSHLATVQTETGSEREKAVQTQGSFPLQGPQRCRKIQGVEERFPGRNESWVEQGLVTEVRASPPAPYPW